MVPNHAQAGIMTNAQPDTQIEFFTCTADTWDAMYRDCAGATRSIYFEQYLLNNDEAGQRFLTLFRDKAREGVDVRILLDGIGSRNSYDIPVIQEIREAGGRVDFYNKLSWRHALNPKTWLPRNHCKTMIIDARITYIGGVCVSAEMQDWHDMHVRLAGELPRLMPISTEYFEPGAHGNDDFEFVISRNREESHVIYRLLLDEIDRSQKSIVLVTPYFFPTRRLRKALARAAMRDVAVTIMISKETDIPFGTFISRSYFPSLIRRGIRIIFYDKDVIHAKYALIDDRWATLGSTNFDYLSLVHNQEANIIIRHQPTIDRLRAIYDADAATCLPVDRRHGFLLMLLKPIIHYVRQRL